VESKASVARQWLVKHASAATNMRTIVKELLVALFSIQAVLKLYKESMRLMTVKHGEIHELGTKNYCADKDQQQ
jgi:hypothetical protein